MLGNLKGWIVSGVIFILTGVMIWRAGQSPEPSKPVGKLTVAMKSSALSIDPKTVLPPGTVDKDAAEMLRQLAKDVHDKRRDLDRLDKARTNKEKRTLTKAIEPELNLLIEASKCSKMTGLFRPEDAVVYGDKPFITDLKRFGMLVNQIGVAYVSEEPKDPARARDLFEASFQLGRFLYEDRIIFKQWRDGVELMQNASFYLASMAKTEKNEAKHTAYTAFQDELNKVGQPARTEWMTIIHPIRSEYPGDIFHIAEKSPDPMWRAEAILKLGRMKWISGVSQADQIHAGKLLEKLAAEPNQPTVVRVAIDRARKLDAAGIQETDREW